MEFEGGRPYQHQENPGQQPKPKEPAKPPQERGEGNKAEQLIVTFDGHEPEAWKRDALIFAGRVLTGLDALQERSRAGVRDRKRIVEKLKAEGAWPVTKDGKVYLDELLSSPREKDLADFFYAGGVMEAYNLMRDHLYGSRPGETRQDESSQDSGR